METPIVLVTGANGQLGMEFREIAKNNADLHFEFVGKEELEIDDLEKVNSFFQNRTFDYCINCAAYTAVDLAETEKEKAFSVNAIGVENLAKSCSASNIKLIHISTDYVFSGEGNIPFEENDHLQPINYYGYTKLEGEKKAIGQNAETLIIRTSWVYSEFGKNFVKTMIRLMNEKESIGVVEDQKGSPTYAKDLATDIVDIISTNKFHSGIFHYCNKGIISWYQFAQAIKIGIDSNCIVHPIQTIDYPTPARRPHFSALNTTKFEQTFGTEIRDWQESLSDCLDKLIQ